MEYLVGVVLAVSVTLAASSLRLDQDRASYPTVLAVVASYYGLFAVLVGNVPALLAEVALMLVFFMATALGFQRNLWLVVVGLLLAWLLWRRRISVAPFSNK